MDGERDFGKLLGNGKQVFKNLKEKMKAKTIICVAMAAASVVAGAATIPAAPFTDNMVLQRGRRVPVWGTAQSGENVTVSFAGQTKRGTAGTDGRWRVDLDPLAASKEPRTLVIGERKIANVLVGEVWLASGQSNMERFASRSCILSSLPPVAGIVVFS